MALKIIDQFDSSFTLDPDAKAALFELLQSEPFLQQVAQQANYPAVEFSELLFQPLPYSAATPKGMPAEFEKFHQADGYVIINVPPNFMFKAKIFRPSRLCAIYRNVSEPGRSQESGDNVVDSTGKAGVNDVRRSQEKKEQ